MVSTSSRLNAVTSLNFPKRGSANHGGISRATTLVLMARAQGRASWYDVSAIGATCPAR